MIYNDDSISEPASPTRPTQESNPKTPACAVWNAETLLGDALEVLLLESNAKAVFASDCAHACVRERVGDCVFACLRVSVCVCVCVSRFEAQEPFLGEYKEKRTGKPCLGLTENMLLHSSHVALLWFCRRKIQKLVAY